MLGTAAEHNFFILEGSVLKGIGAGLMPLRADGTARSSLTRTGLKSSRLRMSIMASAFQLMCGLRRILTTELSTSWERVPTSFSRHLQVVHLRAVHEPGIAPGWGEPRHPADLVQAGRGRRRGAA